MVLFQVFATCLLFPLHQSVPQRTCILVFTAGHNWVPDFHPSSLPWHDLLASGGPMSIWRCSHLDRASSGIWTFSLTGSLFFSHLEDKLGNTFNWAFYWSPHLLHLTLSILNLVNYLIHQIWPKGLSAFLPNHSSLNTEGRSSGRKQHSFLDDFSSGNGNGSNANMWGPGWPHWEVLGGGGF